MAKSNIYIFIKLRNGKNFDYKECINPGFFRTSYHFIYNIQKLQKYVPGYSFECDTIKIGSIYGEINYFLTHGKKRPFWRHPLWLNLHKITKILIILFIIALITIFLLIITEKPIP